MRHVFCLLAPPWAAHVTFLGNSRSLPSHRLSPSLCCSHVTLHRVSITRSVGFRCLIAIFCTRLYYLPGLDGSCSSAHQPKGNCGTDVTKHSQNPNERVIDTQCNTGMQQVHSWSNLKSDDVSRFATATQRDSNQLLRCSDV